MVDRGEFSDIKDKTMIGKLAELVLIEIFLFETATREFEAIKISEVELLEGAYERLHVEASVGLVLAEIGKTDFDLVAEFGGFFFGFGDAVFVTFREFNFDFFTSAAFGWLEKSTESLDKPNPVYDAGFLAGFDFFDPFVGGILVPIVGDWAHEDLDPEFFGGIRIELGESTSDAGKRVDFEIVESFDR